MKILKILEERLSETFCPSFFIQELFAVDSGYKASFKYSLLDKFIPNFHPLPDSMPQFLLIKPSFHCTQLLPQKIL